MIAYILISMAVICFAIQFAFTKLYEGAAQQNTTATLVMCLVTSTIGALLFWIIGGFRVQISTTSLLLGLIFGAVMIPYYLIGIKVLSLGSLALYSMFMMLGGMLVPFFYGVIYLNESISLGKGLGTVLLTLCIIAQGVLPDVSERKQKDKRKQRLFFMLCILIFLINGMTCVIAKIHAIHPDGVDEASFTVICCVWTAVISFVMLLIPSKRPTKNAIKGAFTGKKLLIMAALGAAAHGGNFFHLLAAETVPASVQFPMVSGGVIVLSSLLAATVFKECLSRKEWLRIGGACLSTLLFAF